VKQGIVVIIFQQKKQINRKELVYLMLRVTSEAAEQLKNVLSQQEKEDLYIRIYVNGMG